MFPFKQFHPKIIFVELSLCIFFSSQIPTHHKLFFLIFMYNLKSVTQFFLLFILVHILNNLLKTPKMR